MYGLVPSLTLPQESIKAQQVVSEGDSANHLPERSAPGGSEAGLHMNPQPVQAGTSRRPEESADTLEDSL